ncbi:MAG: cobalamin-dependent protein, partial [Candidatus Hydrothermarchaeota archaeon]|nr:cobalamin-dependent protein [Candidatus Hydrothermarchaeota archaeon]
MRVLLIHPRFPYRGKDSFPLGLGYLAAVAKGNEIIVIDENVETLNLEKINPDIVGITSTTPSFPRAMEIAKTVKKLWRGTTLVIGGTHVTFVPEDALMSGVDVVVRGEGEHAFLELLEGRE